MFSFDPRVGTGAMLSRMMMAEMCMQTADMVAADPLMADSYWQMGVSIAHNN